MDNFVSGSLMWVIWLLTGACGALFIIRFKGTQSAVLGAIGFGIFLGIPLLIQLFWLFQVAWWEYSFVFDLLRTGGWVLILLALFKLPSMAGTQAPFDSQSAGPQMNAAPQATNQSATADWGYARPPQFLSKGLFVGSFLGGSGASILLSLISMSFFADHDEEIAIPILILAFLALIFVAVMVGVLVFRLWESIQPGHPRSTPGKAVGFLFIPLFNLYWAFQAYYGWAQDYNRYVREAQIQAPPVSENMGLTVSVLVVLSCIPYAGVLAGLANLVCMSMFFSQAIDGANALARARMGESQAE